MTLINLIVQYFKVKFSSDIKYKQNEIDYVLKQNCNNKYIKNIYLLLEDDYELDFLTNQEKNKITKILIRKRLSYYDAFNFYNKKLSGTITILANADIYFDDSLYILEHINWNVKQIIAPTRYEHNMDYDNNLLYGTFQNLAINSPWLAAYEESVYTQDVWIWCTDKINIPQKNCDFYLGTVGCDNYIASIFCKYNYIIIASSKYICCNHYDHLSINKSSNIKGNESFIREKRVGTFSEYVFIDSGNKLIDKYVINATNYSKKVKSLDSDIKYVLYNDNILPLFNKLSSFQITASSSPNMPKLNGKIYWEPKSNDVQKEIIIKYNNLIKIPYIDIQGLPYDMYNNIQNCYVTEFEIYKSINGFNFDKVDSVFEGINVSNYNYIKRIYFNNPILCYGLKIKILKYHIRPVIRLEIYYFKNFSLYDIDKKSTAFKNFVFNCNYLDKNRHILKFNNLFNEILLKTFNTNILNHPISLKYQSDNKIYDEFFSYNHIDKNEFWYTFKNYLFENNFNIKQNILRENITPGICLFTYIMNRRSNLEKYFNSWLNKSVNQIIILDWSSNEDNYDIIQKINDSRVLYIKVIGEKTFIRTYAQNLAAKFCKYDKILKLDSDISLSDDFFIKNTIVPGEFIVGNYMCARNENEKYTHGNVYLYLNDFFKIGGYNELITTYGNDDSDFSFRLQLLAGLNEKIFDLDTMYHNPHTNEIRKKNMLGVYNTYVEIFKHRYYMDNIPLWTRYFKQNQFIIEKKYDNYYECKRTTQFIYKFSQFIDLCELDAINLVYEWFSNLPNWKLTNDIKYKKLFLSKI